MSIDGELKLVLLEIICKGKIIPVPIQLHTVDRKADAREIISDDHLEIGKPLIIKQIDVLLIAARPYGDNTKHIPKIDGMMRQKIDIETKIEIASKTK